MSAATVNQHLSNYAYGLAQDVTKGLANFIAPEVPTGVSNGQYKSYNEQNAFVIYNAKRAVGGKARRIEFEGTDPYFNCAPNALEITVDDHERDQAGDMQQQLEEAKTRTLVTSASIAHENEVFTKIFAALSAVGSRGVWSNAGNDPIAEIDEQIEAIATATGMLPNRIVMGIGAWRVAKNHTLVKGRYTGTAKSIDLDGFASMLINPNMEVRVGVLSKDTVKFGGTKTAANIVGAEVLIFCGSDDATIYDPSFAKTFRTRSGGVDRVEKYRDESSNSDVIRVKWTDDTKVTGAACGRRLTIS